jgi:gamma-tubulin complex component 4
MLHEVLLALVGCPGYMIRESDGKYDLAPGVAEEFLHPAEIALVQRICALGYHFRQLEDFVARVKNGVLVLRPGEAAVEPEAEPEPESEAAAAAAAAHTAAAPAAPPRIYLRAVAMAIDVLLEEYMDTVADAELEFLEDPALPLSHLQYLLRHDQLVLPAVHALVAEAEQRDLRGGALVDDLHRRSLTGVPCVETKMLSLLDATHGLLLHQMTAWMVHGVLDDFNHHEFFVRDAQRERGGGTLAPDAGAATEAETSAAPIHEWHSRFGLRVAMLPECIPAAVAEKVLFIGKAMRVLTSSALETGHESLISLEEQERFSAELSRLLRDAPLPSAPASPARSPEDDADPDDVARTAAAAAAAAAASGASRISFNRLELAVTVEGIRSSVARHLWQLVVVDSNLLKPLQGMRDYFLLGRGDLFQHFIEDCNALTQTRPVRSTEKELNVLWRAAAAKAGVEEEEEFKRLEVELQMDAGTDGGAPAGLSVFDAWRRISLSMESRWPLNLLLDEAMASRYNEVRNRCFLATLYLKMIIYQDRLGTNIGKALKKECRFLVKALPAALHGEARADGAARGLATALQPAARLLSRAVPACGSRRRHGGRPGADGWEGNPHRSNGRGRGGRGGRSR